MADEKRPNDVSVRITHRRKYIPNWNCRINKGGGMQRFRGVIVLGWTLALFACGGGGGGPTSDTPPPAIPAPPIAPAGPDFAPMAVGDAWVYRRDDGGLDQVKITGTRTIDGQMVFTYASTNTTDLDTQTGAIRKTSTAITEIPDGSSAFVAALGSYDNLRLPLKMGDSYQQIDRVVTTGFDIDRDNRDDVITVRSTVTVLASEAVTVPAGTFEDCIKVRTVFVQTVAGSAGGPPLVLTGTFDEWFAAGIGLVRSRNEVEEGGIKSVSIQELQSYRVGTQSNDRQPPQVLAVSPASGATIGPSLALTVDFDEALDRRLLNGAGVQLLDTSGAVVEAGFFNVKEKRLEWNKPSGLSGGTYTVRLSDSVQDLLGNRITIQQWPLIIDASGPTVVGTTPAANSVQVALTTVIELRFSEPVNTASVSQSVVLKEGSFRTLPYTVSAPDARTVRLQPVDALQPNTTYEVVVMGTLTDLLGNPLGDPRREFITLNFSTGNGPFLQFQQVNTFINAYAVAAGDVSGDGRADLLHVPPEVTVLQVRRQLPDGTLSAHYDVAWRANTVCVPDVLQIADLNGDGRNDVVVAERGCGVEVLFQDSNGLLQPGPFLPSVNSHIVRVADINSDGRPDIVAVGIGHNGSDSVSVWLQQPDGSWGSAADTPLAYSGSVELAVGDLNGDGRPDIAVSSTSGGLPSSGVGLLYQRANGSFAPVEYLQVGPNSGAAGLAIGDLNGDGRMDLVTSSYFGTDGLAFFFQGADGRLGPLQWRSGFGSILSLLVADLNGDGRSDLLVNQWGAFDAGLVVMFQQSDGSLVRAQQFEDGMNGNLRLSRMAVADLNGDGLVDLVLTGPRVAYATPRASSPSRTVRRGAELLRAQPRVP